MSNAPFYLPKSRWGMRMGHGQVVDSLIKDGLWDARENVHMGMHAERCAKEKGIDRAAQDEHADASYARSLAAIEKGLFVDEIAPVEIQKGKKTVTVSVDEEPSQKKGTAAEARTAFMKENGTVTAFNASSISDRAAAVVLMSRAAAEKQGAKILATIRGHADAEQAPAWFTTAPSLAIPKAVASAGLSMSDVDYYEINEAFSVVSCVNNKILGLDPERVNIHGGAVALGHPIGASGARIVVTLLSVLEQKGARFGVAGICNGGGGATAMVVEREM